MGLAGGSSLHTLLPGEHGASLLETLASGSDSPFSWSIFPWSDVSTADLVARIHYLLRTDGKLWLREVLSGNQLIHLPQRPKWMPMSSVVQV